MVQGINWSLAWQLFSMIWIKAATFMIPLLSDFIIDLLQGLAVSMAMLAPAGKCCNYTIWLFLSLQYTFTHLASAFMQSNWWGTTNEERTSHLSLKSSFMVI